MGLCQNHPDTETAFQCMKYQVYLCEACLKCRDPELYCKFRPQCLIWFRHKASLRRAGDPPEAGEQAGAA